MRHIAKRGILRYGLTFTKEQIKNFSRKIQRGDGNFIRRRSRRITEWEVSLDNVTVRILYDTLHNIVRTVLPPFRKRSLF
ncbi:hypothetical protein HYR65_03490 [Candidatus Azambacteria bacterium]|nr:hypothetical protein [Candidatus Azambacteria bacterium]